MKEFENDVDTRHYANNLYLCSMEYFYGPLQWREYPEDKATNLPASPCAMPRGIAKQIHVVEGDASQELIRDPLDQCCLQSR